MRSVNYMSRKNKSEKNMNKLMIKDTMFSSMKKQRPKKNKNNPS
jgi:hypothetical protein